MPSHSTHRRIAETLGLGGLDHIDSAKDAASPYLGKGHRRVGHDAQANLLLALLDKDPLRALARAQAHDLADRTLTRLKNDLRAQGIPDYMIDLLVRDLEK